MSKPQLTNPTNEQELRENITQIIYGVDWQDQYAGVYMPDVEAIMKAVQEYKGVVQIERGLSEPVENGELLTINNLITKWAQIVGVKDGFSYVVKILIDPADGFADDAFSSNLRNELEALIAQEKAKWGQIVLEDVIGPNYFFTDDAMPTEAEKVTQASLNRLLERQRQALAKLLDKENI